jgi:hypothetical protein
VSTNTDSLLLIKSGQQRDRTNCAWCLAEVNVGEICPLLRYYASSKGNPLPTFRYDESVPASRGKKYLKMGPIRCPETSVKHCHSTLCNNPEEGRSREHCGATLKSRKVKVHCRWRFSPYLTENNVIPPKDQSEKAANIFNKQSWTVDKGWPSSSVFGVGPNDPSAKKSARTGSYTATVTGSSMTCTHSQLFVGRSDQAGRDGPSVWHARGMVLVRKPEGTRPAGSTRILKRILIQIRWDITEQPHHARDRTK